MNTTINIAYRVRSYILHVVSAATVPSGRTKCWLCRFSRELRWYLGQQQRGCGWSQTKTKGGDCDRADGYQRRRRRDNVDGPIPTYHRQRFIVLLDICESERHRQTASRTAPEGVIIILL